MSIFYIQEPELAAKIVDEENEMSVGGSSRTSIGKSDVIARKPQLQKSPPQTTKN
jgi:hypothetical protein